MFEARDSNPFLRRITELFRKLHIDAPFYYFWIYVVERIHPSALMKREAEFYILKHAEVERILGFLDDEKSKLTYKALLAFRTTRKRYMNRFKDYEQYFPKELFCLKSECFVDCGAYIGDTIESFLKYDKEYEAIYAFEPDLENFSRLERFVCDRRLNNTFLYNMATGETQGTLCLTGGGATATVSTEGNILIKVDTMDQVLKGKKVTFIKMDIEGAEEATLKGAQSLIKEQRPILAICIYHSAEDMVNIPIMLHDSLVDYRFYVRHYTVDKSETVFYAVPSERTV